MFAPSTLVCWSELGYTLATPFLKVHYRFFSGKGPTTGAFSLATPRFPVVSEPSGYPGMLCNSLVNHFIRNKCLLQHRTITFRREDRAGTRRRGDRVTFPPAVAHRLVMGVRRQTRDPAASVSGETAAVSVGLNGEAKHLFVARNSADELVARTEQPGWASLPKSHTETEYSAILAVSGTSGSPRNLPVRHDGNLPQDL